MEVPKPQNDVGRPGAPEAMSYQQGIAMSAGPRTAAFVGPRSWSAKPDDSKASSAMSDV